MADPSLFDFMRIPAETLVALDDRTLHFAMQPFHYIVRLVHVVSMAGFFGAIGLLDIRLLGVGDGLALRAYARHARTWLHASFAVAMVTGVALFLYDPVHVGSHAYFAPKLALIVLGLANVLVFHVRAYRKALPGEGPMPPTAKIAAVLSLAIWTGVLVCSSMNVEGIPKVLLR